MADTQQEPSALADRLEIACRNAEKARSKKHLKVEPFLAQIAYIVEANLPAILSALRHPTSGAASEARMIARLGEDAVIEAVAFNLLANDNPVRWDAPANLVKADLREWARDVLDAVSDALKGE